MTALHNHNKAMKSLPSLLIIEGYCLQFLFSDLLSGQIDRYIRKKVIKSFLIPVYCGYAVNCLSEGAIYCEGHKVATLCKDIIRKELRKELFPF